MKLKTIALNLLAFEPIILLIIGLAYWFPSPLRDDLVGVIILIIPILVTRLYLYRRIWVNTNFGDFITAFFILCIINILTAPFGTRGFILIFRPLFGFLIFLYCVEFARVRNTVKPLLQATLLGLFIVGILGLIATEWSGKSLQLASIINLLPRVETFLWEGGFNPNEISGVITWILPLSVAVLLYRRPVRKTTILAGAGFFISAFVLFLGQSLSGLAGTAAGVVFVMTPRRLRLPLVTLIGIVIIGLQTAILLDPTGVIQVASEVAGRSNTGSLQHREELWTSAINILNDYPMTGVGIAMYRQPLIREMYPTPHYSMFDAVHPHNELLQITSDFGIPGAVIFIAWYVIAAGIFLRLIDHPETETRTIAIGLAGGFLAHVIYGLGDAIPLWDRFAFVFWWMLGLTAALDYLTKPTEESLTIEVESVTVEDHNPAR